MLTFTVAITVFRREEFLPHAIQSVLAQTLPPLEILVYSDGRCRAMRETVARLQPDHPIFAREVKRGRHLKGNHLRRLTLEQARGSHVCFLSHDSYLYPTYLATHAENLRENENAISVVPVAYWKTFVKEPGQPTNPDVVNLSDGEIDLTCLAYPTRLALQVGCFAPEMQRLRPADFISYDRLRRVTPVIFRPGPEQAAHF